MLTGSEIRRTFLSARVSAQEASRKTERSEAAGADFPAVGAGGVWDEDHIHDPEEVGCG
jgi:hypothetical protein